MHMTKHVAAVYAADPGPVTPPDPTLEADLERRPRRPLVDEGEGLATVAAHTVVHGRDGEPTHAVAICTGATGERSYAITRDPDAVAEMLDRPGTGRVVELRSTGVTNELRTLVPALSSPQAI